MYEVHCNSHTEKIRQLNEQLNKACRWLDNLLLYILLIREDPLEKKIATHSSILAWEIPWTEKLVD